MKSMGMARSAQRRLTKGDEGLPPGWVRVESRSKPGAFYYAHPATKRTQVERPTERQEQQHSVRALGAAATPVAGARSVQLSNAPALWIACEGSMSKTLQVDLAAGAPQSAGEEAVELEPMRERAQARRIEELRRKMAEEAAARAEEEAEAEEAAKRELLRKATKRKAVAAVSDLDAELVQAVREEDDEQQIASLRSKGCKERRKTWAEEGSDSENDLVTMDDVRKWKEDEDRREREEMEAKRSREEEELARSREAQRMHVVGPARAGESKQMVSDAPDSSGMLEGELSKLEEHQAHHVVDSPVHWDDSVQSSPTGSGRGFCPQGLKDVSCEEIPNFHTDVSESVRGANLVAGSPLSCSSSALQSHNSQRIVFASNSFDAITSASMIGSGKADCLVSNEEGGRLMGTILWYSGRRQIGLLRSDDSRTFCIPWRGAHVGDFTPPLPSGLMHGTRVMFFPAPGQNSLSIDVHPVEGQEGGLCCGGDSQLGRRLLNEDRSVATDLSGGLGHMAGVFDGHRGTFCADFLTEKLPGAVEAKFLELLQCRSQFGRPNIGSSAEEVEMISKALVAGFEAVDHDYLQTAQHFGWGDGASSLVVLLAHGFDIQEAAVPSTLPNAPGGQAKLFAAWCGTSRAVLLRGRHVVRCTEEHLCEQVKERARLEAMGAIVVQDVRGMWWAGRPDKLTGVWARRQGFDQPSGPRLFSAASRGFGDLELKKVQSPVLVATPEIRVVDLVPEDWAVVLATRGVFSVLSDQEVADACWESIAIHGQGPVEAAQSVTRLACQRGASANSTAIVMRLGWAWPPPAASPASY